MKKIVFFLFLAVSCVSQAKLQEAGDKLIIKDDRRLADILEKKCVEKLLVDSGNIKRMVLLGYKLQSIELQVQDNHFVGKHILVDAVFGKADDIEGQLTFATEFRCNMDLSDRVYLPVK